jgi:arginyl-tRNA synthetase
MLCAISRIEFDQIYSRLDIKLEEVGESFYNPMLRPLVDELVAKGIAVESDGAICIFVPKQKVPLIIQKSDGGFNYDTTDVAAIRYRIEELKVDRAVYVTDLGQEFHFKQIFKAGELCKFYDPKVTRVDHMGFGLVLQESKEEVKEGEKKKLEKIKTRSGDSIKLMELLNEATERALA